MPEIEAHTINHLINKTFEMSVVTGTYLLLFIDRWTIGYIGTNIDTFGKGIYYL